MLQAALFDFDGTIFHSERIHQSVIFDTMHEQFGTDIDEDELRALSGLRYTDRLAQMLAMRGIDDEALHQKLLARANELLIGREAPAENLIAGVATFITRLHARHIRLAVVSSSNHAHIDELLRVVDLRQYFEYIVGADDVTCRKPHPEPYETTLHKLKLAAKNCIVFEDTPPGIEAAHLAGLSVVGLLTTCHEADLIGTVHTMHDYTTMTVDQLQTFL